MEKIRNIVEHELTSLDKAIDYAEEHSKDRRFEFHDSSILESLGKIHFGQQRAYREFMRVAWGKAVRINSERNGEIVYRLSQAAAIIPRVGIATPQSPVGRLVNIARAGDIYESSALGTYSVEDVWYFERYFGHEFSVNIKNFKSMVSEGQNVFSISNLKKWLQRRKDKGAQALEESVLEEDALSAWGTIVLDKDDPEIAVNTNGDTSHEPTGISLSTRFYVNLTKEQYDAAHFGPAGLVFVFGVAGSGKTSVALGRSKSLSQLGQLPKHDPNYNPDFSEEAQIGIVRTSELIGYLKDTCNMLELHRLPIVEYKEVYEELKAHWGINRATNGATKYLLSPERRIEGLETKRAWFDLVAAEMLGLFRKRVLQGLQTLSEKTSHPDGNIFERIKEVVVSELGNSLSSKNPIGFLARVQAALTGALEILFEQTTWLGVSEGENSVFWFSYGERGFSEYLINRRKLLCVFKSSRNIDIVVPDLEVRNWREWIPEKATWAPVIGDGPPAQIDLRTLEGQTLSMKVAILSERDLATVAREGRLRFYKGIGERTQIIRTDADSVFVVDMPKIIASSEEGVGAEKITREWRRRKRERVRGRIKGILSQCGPTDLFVDALMGAGHGGAGALGALWGTKKSQIEGRRLSESDIDLLIAFTSAVTRGLKEDELVGGNRALAPGPYRSSVFIDEVQDFSEIQILSLALLSDPQYDSVTAVGDPAQCLSRVASDISVSFPDGFWQNAKRQELRQNIRQEQIPLVSALSAKFRNLFIGDIEMPVGRFQKNIGLSVFHRDDRIEQLREVYRVVASISAHETVVIVAPSVASAKDVVGVLGPHLREREDRECEYSTTIDLSKRYVVHVSTVGNIKGLEFDHLIAVHFDEYGVGDVGGRNSVYVILTRARKMAYLIGNFEKVDRSMKMLIEEFVDIDGY